MKKYEKIICSLQNKQAIDLGCGLGQDSAWLSERGFSVISCDISSIALNKLKEIYPNAKTLYLDIVDGLPFENNSIGLINANLSLHYFDMKTTQKIFDDIYSKIEKGGLFIGRMNSDKNDYVNEHSREIEKDYYYDMKNGKYSRLFNKEQFEVLTTKFSTLVLNEDETVRLGRKKYTWEFIFKKT